MGIKIATLNGQRPLWSSIQERPDARLKCLRTSDLSVQGDASESSTFLFFDR